MRVLVVSTIVPFVEGGGHFIADWLYDALRRAGYKADLIKIPFHSDYNVMLEQLLALRLFDLADCADRLIAIRTPSYLVKHPNKVVWFIHHHRGAYDLWGTIYQDIPNTPEGERIRNAIIRTDNEALRETRKVFTNSQVVSERLRKFNRIESEVLHPPLADSEKYYPGEYGDYVVLLSRMVHHKRQHLAIESLKYSKSGAKLVLAGEPDTEDYIKHLRKLVKNYHLENKVRIIDHWISFQEKINLFANALGCLYVPYDEDSYGFVTLEGYHSHKPVITCDDSGGSCEMVEDGVTGFVAPPDPKAIGELIDRLYHERELAAKMGRRGYERIRTMNINWENVVGRLVG